MAIEEIGVQMISCVVAAITAMHLGYKIYLPFK